MRGGARPPLPPMAKLSAVRGPSLIPVWPPAGNNFLTACNGVSPGFNLATPPANAARLAMPASCSVGAPAFLAWLLDNAPAARLPSDFMAPGTADNSFPYCATLLRNAAESILAAESGSADLISRSFACADLATGLGSQSRTAYASVTQTRPSNPAC